MNYSYHVEKVAEIDLDKTLNARALNNWKLFQMFERSSANLNNPGRTIHYLCIFERSDAAEFKG